MIENSKLLRSEDVGGVICSGCDRGRLDRRHIELGFEEGVPRKAELNDRERLI